MTNNDLPRKTRKWRKPTVQSLTVCFLSHVPLHFIRIQSECDGENSRKSIRVGGKKRSSVHLSSRRLIFQRQRNRSIENHCLQRVNLTILTKRSDQILSTATCSNVCNKRSHTVSSLKSSLRHKASGLRQHYRQQDHTEGWQRIFISHIDVSTVSSLDYPVDVHSSFESLPT